MSAAPDRDADSRRHDTRVVVGSVGRTGAETAADSPERGAAIPPTDRKTPRAPIISQGHLAGLAACPGNACGAAARGCAEETVGTSGRCSDFINLARRHGGT